MSNDFYNQLKQNRGAIATLIDPEKFDRDKGTELLSLAERARIDYLFIGGSTVDRGQFHDVCEFIKAHTTLPLIGFPGDVYQYSPSLDALLYLSLLSGRNSEYLIGQHIHTAKEIASLNIETVPTSYLLLDGGKPSATAYVSQTTPIPQSEKSIIERTVIAGKLQGKKCVYLDAGSGAVEAVKSDIIEMVASIQQPLIVGGGIRTIQQIENAAKAGANLIVIGNHLEDNPDFLLDILHFKKGSYIKE